MHNLCLIILATNTIFIDLLPSKFVEKCRNPGFLLSNYVADVKKVAVHLSKFLHHLIVPLCKFSSKSVKWSRRSSDLKGFLNEILVKTLYFWSIFCSAA